MKPLPIDSLLPEIVQAVRENAVVLLEAEPGAGKTTRVPPALLDAGFSQTLVLEPRRIAARMAARRVAVERGEQLGETVGYQVRYEEVASSRTRLWFLTEGILTRRLFGERELNGVNAVVLDEFHERHLETDTALALLRALQENRPELKLVLMSATLHAERLASALGRPPVIKASGRTFPVRTQYTPYLTAPLEEQAASALGTVLPKQTGHALVFLPGAAEIRRAIAACEPIARQHGAAILPLHGDLSPEQQDAAVAPSEQRKIICSTNIAESSLTIENVDTVIDSGLARVLSYSPWSGVPRLRVEKISRSSAVQRAGRAGRTRPGVAVRLYPESDFVRRPDELLPEILRADLSQLTLQLSAAGLKWDDLPWLDLPPVENRAHAFHLLLRLGALDADGQITYFGKRMSTLPIHPRLAAFVWKANGLGVQWEAALIAAQLSEGRLRFNEKESPDIQAILQAEISPQVRRVQQELNRQLGLARCYNLQRLDEAMLFAYSDRVGKVRGQTVLLSNGTSAKLPNNSTRHSEFLVAVDVEDRGGGESPLIRIAADIQADWLLHFFPDRVQAEEQMVWNREGERVEQLSILKYDSLVIDESRSAPADVAAAAHLLAEKAMESGLERFVGAEDLGRFRNRLRFAEENGAPPAPADLETEAVRRLAHGLTSFAELRTAMRDGAFFAVLETMLPMRAIDEIAPTHVKLPSGRRARVEYHHGRPPSVASRLQDFLGMSETPTVARGSVPLTVHLLAPNQRPVQVTTDLVSFWKNLYPQVRRELSRRYPKHAWPESPVIQ